MKVKSILVVCLLTTMNIFSQTKHSLTSAHPTLNGLTMAGYQGWFSTPGDKFNLNWQHYSFGTAANIRIECWPDMSECDDDEKYPAPAPFNNPQYYVYSSTTTKTIDRHFRWMEEYGIDGIHLQRFANGLSASIHRTFKDSVTVRALKAAEKYNKAFSIMYDLSGMNLTTGYATIRNDWKHLVNDLKLTTRGDNQSYLYLNAKPLVSLWGIGFNDGNRPNLDSIMNLIKFFKNDPQYGNVSVLLGVPFYWRAGGGDAVTGIEYTKLIATIKAADVVFPWVVGRYGDLNGISGNYASTVTADKTWCDQNNLEYLCGVYPGFSWHNLINSATSTDISRLGGQFLWNQMYELTRSNKVKQIYVAMFDEMDEATQIFKINNNPPVNPSPGFPFLTYPNLPNDHYLYLTGQGNLALKQKFTITKTLPVRLTNTSLPVSIVFSAVSKDVMNIKYVGNLNAGNKLYAAYYLNKIPNGAPAQGVIRNSSLFKIEITASGTNFPYKLDNGTYLSFVEVDSNDKTIRFHSENITIPTSLSEIKTSNIKAWYNKATSQIKISDANNKDIELQSINDVTGKSTLFTKLSDDSWSLVNTPNSTKLSGVYFARFKIDNQSKIFKFFI